MEACLLITTTNKPKKRKGKVLIINAVKEVKQEKNIAYLESHHINRIYKGYIDFKAEEGFSRVVENDTILENKGSLIIAQFVSNVDIVSNKSSLNDNLKIWEKSSEDLKGSMYELFNILK